ncbi:MAG: hypothetical protein A3A33_02970 [Candidatus Yanofskybacteria bacterium RIFCSPLOWO2_01_FULL_49_25]|uniref:Uncharacterized protein n=1 Tax=Candidatus Yanofskybacteria bacterium RIFCSPLOWO2_01_FULL_49_25 TaxID=1802701 RepID=A0A1F8GSN0_9BACT|nr:MAG: hypothetical protein A3A33_02970 [Candidatus Yanofskybacteria bacterium RIFCSPLOWO2_01_FULL_49_25]
MKSKLTATCRVTVEGEDCGSSARPAIRITENIEGLSLESLGRQPFMVGPYCSHHGGRRQAIRDLRMAWVFSAPASWGDQEAVNAAGMAAHNKGKKAPWLK